VILTVIATSPNGAGGTEQPCIMEEDNASIPPENGEANDEPTEMSISSDEVNYLIYRYVDLL